VDDTYANFGELSVSGIDYQVSYSGHTRYGTWSPSLSATEIYRYTAALVPGLSPLDVTDRAQDSGNWAPRWKGTAALGWVMGQFAASIDGRYVGSYQDYDSARRIGNMWFCDPDLRFSTADIPGVREAHVSVGAVNVFNRLPQASNYLSGFPGFDPAQADLRGRFVYAAVGVKW
jgi:iron complex outermembrane receptor protein